MRIFSTLILFFVLSCYSLSTVITASHDAAIPAQFNDLRQAINSATAGDTIYFQGNTPNYSIAVPGLSKRIVLIGNGFDSAIGSIEFANGSSGTVITNIRLNEIYSFLGSLNNIIVRHCRLNSIVSIGNNALIQNNIIHKVIRLENATNIVISNNIFEGVSDLNHIGGIKTSNQSSVIIKNNYFSKSGQGNVFDNISNAKIYNNIFRTGSPAGASLCDFNNNLTFETNQNTLPYGNNTGSNNINNQNPQVINETQSQWTINHDLKLKDGSPGEEAGLDGTDIGIYGGQFPWKDYDNNSPNYSGRTFLPNVTNFKILLDPVGLNSNLRFEVIGKIPNKKP